MTDNFEASYEIDDGYAGGSRPQHFTISANDLEEDMTDEDLERFYEELCEEDMRTNIGLTPSKSDQFIEWARGQIERRLKEQA